MKKLMMAVILGGVVLGSVSAKAENEAMSSTCVSNNRLVQVRVYTSDASDDTARAFVSVTPIVNGKLMVKRVKYVSLENLNYSGYSKGQSVESKDMKKLPSLSFSTSVYEENSITLNLDAKTSINIDTVKDCVN